MIYCDEVGVMEEDKGGRGNRSLALQLLTLSSAFTLHVSDSSVYRMRKEKE